MPNQVMEQNRIEAETLAYKMFMRVAKKLRYLEYGKWSIIPDAQEPLRRFTIEKEIAWGKVKLCLYTEEYRKRVGNYTTWEERTGFRHRIGVKGLFNDQRGEVLLKSGLQLKPRMVKKLLEHVNTRVIPEYYNVIERDRIEFETKIQDNKIFADNVASLKGLVSIERDRWNRDDYKAHHPDGAISWKGLTQSEIRLHKDDVSMDLRMPYDTAKKLLEVLNHE